MGILRLGGVSPGVTTADWSANGASNSTHTKLTAGKPFVTLDNIAIQERYLSSLPGWSDPDHALSAEQAADAVEWKAFVDGLVTDLVVSPSRTPVSALMTEPHHVLAPPQSSVSLGRAARNLPLPAQHVRPAAAAKYQQSPTADCGPLGPRRRLRRCVSFNAHAHKTALTTGDDTDVARKKLEDSIVVAPGGTKTDRAWSGWRSGRETAERQRKFGEEAVSLEKLRIC